MGFIFMLLAMTRFVTVAELGQENACLELSRAVAKHLSHKSKTPAKLVAGVARRVAKRIVNRP